MYIAFKRSFNVLCENNNMIKILAFLFNLLPVKKGKIVFKNFAKGYGCNPKYIAEEILRQNLPYELVFVSKKNNGFPEKIEVVTSKIGTYYALSTANVIVANSRIGNYFLKGFKKKKNQLYIQTWHGSLGIKKMEGDCENLSSSYLKQAKADSQNIDCLLSNSKWLTTAFNSSFFYDGKIVETGNARNDIFFSNNQKTKEKVYKYFNLKKDVKICLYAPTFRDDKNLDCYALDYEELLKTLESKFGCGWVIISRLHPNISKFQNIIPEIRGVYDGGKYPDIQELLFSADTMITDYSSCIFDFMLSIKPAFVFATDIKKYNTDRGFYYPLETTPFPIAVNNEELVQNIAEFKQKPYQDAVKKFIKDKGCADKGDAAKQCVNLIKKHIERI